MIPELVVPDLTDFNVSWSFSIELSRVIEWGLVQMNWQGPTDGGVGTDRDGIGVRLLE